MRAKIEYVHEMAAKADASPEGFLEVARQLGGLSIGVSRVLDNQIPTLKHIESSRLVLTRAIAAKILGSDFEVRETMDGKPIIVRVS